MCKACSFVLVLAKKQNEGIQCHVLKLQIIDFIFFFCNLALRNNCYQTEQKKNPLFLISYVHAKSFCLFIITVAALQRLCLFNYICSLINVFVNTATSFLLPLLNVHTTVNKHLCNHVIKP